MTIRADGIFKDQPGNREVQSGLLNYAADSGAVNAFVVDIKPAPYSYENGMPIVFVASHTCTGPCTVQVNSLGPISIYKDKDTALEAGDIEAGQVVSGYYYNGAMQMTSVPQSLNSRVESLEDKNVKCTWYEVINNGTSGTLTPPTNGTILLDQWAAGVDALASNISGGMPTFESPVTATGVTVTATLDASGNWTLVGTPSIYPVAVIYAYTIAMSNLNSAYALGGLEVVFEPDVHSVNGLSGDVIIDIPEAGTDFLTPEAITLAYEPIITAPGVSPATKFWSGEKLWTEIVVGGVGYTALVYPTNITSTIVGTYKQASYLQDVGATTLTVTASSAGDVLGEEFLYEQTLGITTVDPGKWYFNFYAKVDSVVGDSRLRFDIFVRTEGGSETVLVSAYSENLTTSYTRVEGNYIGTTYAVNSTDRMGVKVYGNSTSIPTRTISYVIGDGDASYLSTPLAIRHAQLRDKNGEESYQHVSAAQKAYLAQATSDAMGVAELATSTEAVTGTDAQKIITPSSLTSRLAAPGTIGGTTAADGYFTTLSCTTITGDGSSLSNVGQTAANAISFNSKAGETLKKGQGVYIGAGTGDLAVVYIADNSVEAKCRIAGICTADTASGSQVLIRRTGEITLVDTSSAGPININDETWSQGDLLYLMPGGGLTNTKPASGRVVKVAYTEKGSSATDTLLVIPFENPIWICAAAAESPILRMGDSIGATGVSFRNYENTEVASLDSYGYFSTQKIKAKSSAGLFLQDDGGNGMFIKDGGNIGIGTEDPTYKLDISTTSLLAFRLTMTSSSSESGGAVSTLATNDGAALASGDRFATWYFSGACDGSGTLVNAVAMSAYATEVWTSGARGSKLTFEGTSDTTSGRAVWATLRNAKLGIAQDNPAYELDVTGSGRMTTSLLTAKVRAADSAGLYLVDDGDNGIFVKDGGNVGINTIEFGTSAVKVISIGQGTAPTTSPADVTQVWSANLNAQAGMNRLHTRTESGATGPLAIQTEIAPTITSKQKENGVVQGGVANAPVKVLDNSNLDLGTGDFSVVWRGSFADWATGSNQALCYKRDGSSPYNGFYFYNNTSGIPYGTLYRNDTGAAFSAGVANSFTDGSVHEICVVVVRETAGAAGTGTFYFDGIPFGTVGSITAAETVSIDSTSDLYVTGTSTARTASSTSMFSIYNRALTASEVASIYINGIDFADKWASQADFYTSSFTAGVDGWNAVRSTVTGNVDSIGGQNDCLSCYADNSTNTHYFYKSTTTDCLGKNVWITLDYYIPSTNTNVDGIRVGSTSSGVGTDGLVLDTWTTITKAVFISTTASYDVLISMMDGGVTSFTGAGSASDDLVYIKNVRLQKTGALIGLQPEGVQPGPGQWLDSSSNANHGLQGPTGSDSIRPMKTFEVRWTNTWAGTHEAQYIGGSNQAILPVNCYITDIIGTVSGATVEDIIIGDGSDVDRWVTITSGLAAGTQAFTVANRISDGTNYKLVVDPDANFTGSIAFLIKGIIL
jgi:hypothetical protein